MANCLSILGIIWLVITNLAVIIAFSTPFWVEDWMIQAVGNEGLWARCGASSCTWVFENDFYLEKRMPDWFKAVQALFAVGLGCGLLALLFATLSLCCQCKNCNPSAVISAILIIAFLAIGISLIIYGAKGNSELGITIELSIVKMGQTFGWSYWLGVAAALSCLFTSILYACDCRRKPTYY